MQQILCEIAVIDRESLFYNPVPTDALPNYKKIVRRPLSLSTIAAYIAATTTTRTVVSSAAANDVASHVNPTNSHSHSHGHGAPKPVVCPHIDPAACRPYAWQAFEDDLVSMLMSCIAYNKIGSHCYAQAVRVLQQLPEVFARHAEGRHSYSRVASSSSASASLAASSSAAQGGKAAPKRGRITIAGGGASNNNTNNNNKAAGELSTPQPPLTASQLREEALMLHFTALFAEDMAGALTSVLLTSPVAATSVQFAHSFEAPTPLHSAIAALGGKAHQHNTDPRHAAAVASERGFNVAFAAVAASSGKSGAASQQSPDDAAASALLSFVPIPNHLIPTTVEALRQRVIAHAFPSLGAFLRTVSLMLGFAVACCCDDEAVDILVAFQRKIDDQCAVFCPPPQQTPQNETQQSGGNEAVEGDNVHHHTSQQSDTNKKSIVSGVIGKAKEVYGEANTSPPLADSLANLREAIAATASALRPLCCESIADDAERNPLVVAAVHAVIGGGGTNETPAATSSPSHPALLKSTPSSSSAVAVGPYESSIVNKQDASLRASAMALVACLAVADTTASFHRPFIVAEYMGAISSPIDLYTMKIKALLGHYTVPFVGHLPDTRARRATAEVATATAEQSVGDTAGGDANVATAVSDEEEGGNSKEEEEPPIDYAVLDAVRAAIRADVDVMVDNCTFYNGPDHALSRLITDMRRTFAAEARKCGL